jgi:ABC-type polar amino acid transport system ATPase subunit
MATLLSVRDLHVRFVGRERTVHAVNGVSFDLAAGEVLGILGESGSGKSVTLRAILGLLPARRTRYAGSIAFEGKELLGLPDAAFSRLRGKRIAMIFQEPATSFDPVYTVGRQITETIIRHDGGTEAAAAARAKELLELVRIPSAAERLKAYPHEMSGGMRQRAMIALALACRPEAAAGRRADDGARRHRVQIQVLLLRRSCRRTSPRRHLRHPRRRGRGRGVVPAGRDVRRPGGRDRAAGRHRAPAGASLYPGPARLDVHGSDAGSASTPFRGAAGLWPRRRSAAASRRALPRAGRLRPDPARAPLRPGPHGAVRAGRRARRRLSRGLPPGRGRR